MAEIKITIADGMESKTKLRWEIDPPIGADQTFETMTPAQKTGLRIIQFAIELFESLSAAPVEITKLDGVKEVKSAESN